jgi:hypothetical protein
MRRRATSQRFSWWVLAAGLALLVAGTTRSAPPEAAAGRVPKPVIEAGKGDKCVEDTEFMRKNHMKLLLHQRDETVINGVRAPRYSLDNCIECHASRKTNSVVGSNDNFCQSCHAYAGVKLDCFECHASKPRATAFHPLVPEHGARTESEKLALMLRQRLGAGVAPDETGAKP